ncbi:hypothetical protein CVIRNUC_009488 [Coccomyxa viridis]|uniref:Hydroxyproline O-arabinosyltransferase-like domain-containing protein n=1 Tax=Coccomyxa viridis TaxID=1274662 RepID=A0AAV1IJS5_9CHLO|nr:hypothetical protein CVIRNUC_009488 [Coccomyxa viridis]
MTGCHKTADWQAIGLYHSFLRSQQPGRFVRIAACLPGENAPTKLVPTWTTQGVIELDHVVYPLFNKPWALSMYLRHAHVTEDYILVLDSDMLLRRPMLPAHFRVSESTAAAENMWYLEDLNTILVPELMPDLAVKLDNDAVPGKGRRADEVGEFYLMHRKDWAVVAPKWYQHSLPVMKMMLHKPQLWQERNLTQTKPWYGEMYAYTLATAEAGVSHLATNSTVFHMRYYHPHGDPHLSHYAWYAEVSNMSRQWEGKSWQWNKHDYKDFEVELCPRWNAKQGLFPDPPLPSELTTKGGDFIRDLLSIEAVALLNEAFCRLHHLRHCSKYDAAAREQCAKVEQLNREIARAWQGLRQQPGGLHCVDMLPEGVCRKDTCHMKRLKYSEMRNYCRKTCDYCEGP